MCQLYQTTVLLSGLNIEKGDLADPLSSKWNSSGIKIPGVSSAQTAARCGIASTSSGLCLAWNQAKNFSDGNLMASFYSEAWGGGLTLLDMNGSALQTTAAADVSIAAWGSGCVLIACPSVASGIQHGLYLGAYRVADADIDDKHNWQACWSCNLAPTKFGLKQTGSRVSIDWFPTAVDNGTNATLELYLVVFLRSDAGSQFMSLPMQVSSDQTYVSPIVPANTILLSPLFGAQPKGVNVIRDPANRMMAYTSDGAEKSLFRAAWNTCSPLPTPFAAKLGEASFNAPKGGSGLVAPVYYMRSGSGSFNFYEILLYPEGNGTLYCQVNFFGAAEMQPSQTHNFQEKVVLLGIVDGPIPFPNVNSMGHTFSSGAEYDAGVIRVSSSVGNSSAVQSTGSMTFGLQVDEHCTEGVGIAVQASTSAGWTNVAGSSSVSLSTTFQDMYSPLDMETKTIFPYGTLWCSNATLTVQTYKFTDAQGNVIYNSSQCRHTQAAAPFYAASAEVGDLKSQQYVPYSVTPGDLSTYTPEGWDKTMKELGYSGKSYFNEVIVANACVLDNVRNYIEASWSLTGVSEQSAAKTTSTFTAYSWQFDASVYAGVSGGGGVDFFGLGEKAEVSILAGMSTSYVHELEPKPGLRRGKSHSTRTGDRPGTRLLTGQATSSMSTHFAFIFSRPHRGRRCRTVVVRCPQIIGPKS